MKINEEVMENKTPAALKKIFVADMTIGDALKNAAADLSFKEKLEIARSLDKLGADVIELCQIKDDKTDPLLIRTICPFLKTSSVSVNAGTSEEGVSKAYAAVSSAVNPRLSIGLPLSPALIEYELHKKPAEVLALTKNLVSKAKSLCCDVEFRAIDYTRAEKDFLYSVLDAAIASGATVVTLCDNEGCNLPAETELFIKDAYKNVPALKNVRLGYLCENTSGLGLSSLITAAICGAEEIKTAVGVPGYTSLDRLSELLRNRGDSLNLMTSLSNTELARHTNQIKWIISAKKNELSAFDNLTLTAKTGDTGKLTASDDIKTVNKAVKKLGYDLSDDDKKKVYEEFLRVAAKKPIGERELDAIVASAALQVPEYYKLISYLINSGNLITASANISLERGGETLNGICLGDGPIDAAFLALEQIVGRHFELDDFEIQSVTEGREAMGSALVKLRSNGKLYSGRGLSTDIIGASIRAYVSALNKIVYEEE